METLVKEMNALIASGVELKDVSKKAGFAREGAMYNRYGKKFEVHSFNKKYYTISYSRDPQRSASGDWEAQLTDISDIYNQLTCSPPRRRR